MLRFSGDRNSGQSPILRSNPGVWPIESALANNRVVGPKLGAGPLTSRSWPINFFRDEQGVESSNTVIQPAIIVAQIQCGVIVPESLMPPLPFRDKSSTSNWHTTAGSSPFHSAQKSVYENSP